MGTNNIIYTINKITKRGIFCVLLKRDNDNCNLTVSTRCGCFSLDLFTFCSLILFVLLVRRPIFCRFDKKKIFFIKIQVNRTRKINKQYSCNTNNAINYSVLYLSVITYILYGTLRFYFELLFNNQTWFMLNFTGITKNNLKFG